MDDKEFNSFVQQTRLSKDSREAARLVLVENMTQVEAAAQMGMSPQRVNQIVKTVKAVQAQQESSKVNATEIVAASYAFAVKHARDQYGDEVRISEIADAKRYVGPVVARTDFHLVQSLGKDAVAVHELAKLDRVPPVGKSVAIEYQRGRATILDRSQEKERGGISR